MKLAQAWTAAAGAAVVGVVWALSHVSAAPGAAGAPAPEPRAPGPAAVAEEGAARGANAGAAELARLESRMAALERGVATAQQGGPAEEAAAEGRDEAPGEAEEPPDPEVLAAALAQTIDEALEAEAVDPEWKTAMSGQIDAFFEAEALRGSSVRRAECRSTLCRVEVVSESAGAKKELADRISGILPPRAQGFARIDGESDLEIEVYILREGRALPEVRM